MKPIILEDGTSLTPFEADVKSKLEEEINIVLEKYGATYLPVIRETSNLSSKTQTAVLLLMKINKDIKSPFIENGGENNKTEETPETN